MNDKNQKPTKRRTVKAPQQSTSGELPPNCVLSVELAGDEDVSWAWTQLPNGDEYVSGYSISKKSTNR